MKICARCGNATRGVVYLHGIGEVCKECYRERIRAMTGGTTDGRTSFRSERPAGVM